ncbi:MAG: hypothetical protein DWQ37_09110 [Planctomycetota bacterium]|nr:MAG: hypothetical protein DWQ37_09110 [Planctomycetota bacterium]
MKLHRSCDVVPDGSGLVCRQGRVYGIVTFAVFSAAFACPVGFGYAAGIPWLGIPFGLFALLIVPLLWGDMLSRFRSSNWLLWIRPDGLWIHLRSYRDQSPHDRPAVVELSYAEIAQIGRHAERYSVQSRRSRQYHKVDSLQVRLRQPETGEFEAALAAGRQTRQPERVFLGFIRSRARLTHFPVSLPSPEVIRIAWRGGYNHAVVPSLRRALAELSQHAEIAEPAGETRKASSQISDAEIDDRVLELVKRGDRLDAARLLVHERNYTLTQAKRFVDELDERV